MKRAVIALAVVVLAGCGSSAKPVHVSAALPPPAATWPRYPHFARTSCWTRLTEGKPLADAPSYVAAATHRTPREIAAALLRRLGDRRYVERVVFAPPPPVTREHTGWFPHRQPPKAALWAYVAVAQPKGLLAKQIADWEAGLVTGALRDEICAAGGAPLVGWRSGGQTGVSDSAQALGQRFPAESRAVFLRRLALVGKRYGFGVARVRFLRPLQAAPLVVVRTSRPRKEFVKDVVPIMQLLDPRNGQAVTFEGFFFAAEGSEGPFVSVFDVFRGQVMGGQWAWDPCELPYPHSGPINSRC